jgi:hypothetical protein
MSRVLTQVFPAFYRAKRFRPDAPLRDILYSAAAHGKIHVHRLGSKAYSVNQKNMKRLNTMLAACHTNA